MIFKSKVRGPVLSEGSESRGLSRLVPSMPEGAKSRGLSRATCPERSRGKSRGFTLIELLIVIAIIGILAGIIIVNLNAARQKSRDAKRKADIASIQTAIEMYADRNGNYPIVSSWVESTLPEPWISVIPRLVPEFISVLPKDPSTAGSSCNWPGQYKYWYKSDGNDYKIFVAAMESSEGRGWAQDDGGAKAAGPDNDINMNTCPCSYNTSLSDPQHHYAMCAYELFSSNAKQWVVTW